jgi:hypothetical protein
MAIRDAGEAVSSVEVYETALRMLERYGFGLVLASLVLWFVRVDIVIPMVEAHSQFLKEMAVTQRDIANAVHEQTRLLYALRDSQERPLTTSTLVPDAGRN